MKYPSQLRPSLTGTVAGLASITLILLAGTACQTNKAAKGPDKIGDNVEMVELRQVIHTQIPDPKRAAALTNMVGFAEQELGAINKSFSKYSKAFAKTSANHAKGADALNRILQEWNAETRNRRTRLVDALLAMKAQAEPNEWPAISNAFFDSVKRQSDRYQALQPSQS